MKTEHRGLLGRKTAQKFSQMFSELFTSSGAPFRGADLPGLWALICMQEWIQLKAPTQKSPLQEFSWSFLWIWLLEQHESEPDEEAKASLCDEEGGGGFSPRSPPPASQA